MILNQTVYSSIICKKKKKKCKGKVLVIWTIVDNLRQDLVSLNDNFCSNFIVQRNIPFRAFVPTLKSILPRRHPAVYHRMFHQSANCFRHRLVTL